MKLKKRIAGNEWINRAVAFILVAYIRFCYFTTRWEKDGLDELFQVVASGQPVIIVVWHERLLMTPCMVDSKAGKYCAIVTKSRMTFLGRFMLRHFGIDALTIPPKANQLSLIVEVLRRIKAKQSIVISPDGTRGPPRVSKDFPLVWSRSTQIPIFCCAHAVRRSVRLPTWDRAQIALPFNRGAMIMRRWEKIPPRETSEEELEALRIKLEQGLNDITDEADRRVNRPLGSY